MTTRTITMDGDTFDYMVRLKKKYVDIDQTLGEMISKGQYGDHELYYEEESIMREIAETLVKYIEE